MLTSLSPTEAPQIKTSQNAYEQLRARYKQVRNFSEKLREPLLAEDCVIQSMPDASPTKWHLAHTSWFFETFVLKAFFKDYKSPVPEYAFLFNSYYNALGKFHQRDQRGMISRPGLEDTKKFRRDVDDSMKKFFDEVDEDQFQRFQPILELGLHHEQQHQELIVTDIKHVLAQNPLYPVYKESLNTEKSSAPAQIEWVNFDEGLYWIGHDPKSGFSFDNEGPAHREFLNSFQFASRLVTNGEYLKFIEAKGYQTAKYWLSLGWATVQASQWEYPLYWQKDKDGQWYEFTLGGLRKLDLNAPVCHVSFFEAEAYARFVDARLATEAEWEIATRDIEPSREDNFVESGYFHPQPSSTISACLPSSTISACLPSIAKSGNKISQCFGDVWEWTRSAYSPYPGYLPAPGAIGEYNGKFMCNQYVLRGGSCATSLSHIRRTYRNFFPTDKRWQFTGIRLARDVR